MTQFSYTAPPTLEESLKILEEHPTSKIFAGGTDLLVKLRDGVIKPELVVDIKNIPGLNEIRLDDDGTLWIGSLTTHRDISHSPIIKELYPILAQASGTVGSQQIRNKGTIGGNICTCSPCADTLPVLTVLSAKLHIENPVGKRILPVEEFYVGPQKTVLTHSEILTYIEIPTIKGNPKGSYLRMGRRTAVAIAMVTCAVLRVEDTATPSGYSFKIALGSVAPTIVRAKTAEEFLNNLKKFTPDDFQQAGNLALKDVSPITDVRTTKEYRNDMVSVLVKRCLNQIEVGN